MNDDCFPCVCLFFFILVGIIDEVMRYGSYSLSHADNVIPWVEAWFLGIMVVVL